MPAVFILGSQLDNSDWIEWKLTFFYHWVIHYYHYVGLFILVFDEIDKQITYRSSNCFPIQKYNTNNLF